MTINYILVNKSRLACLPHIYSTDVKQEYIFLSQFNDARKKKTLSLSLRCNVVEKNTNYVMF